jgi:uncharacterized protein (TIGR02271 family)
MAKTVVGLFDSRQHAEMAVQDLMDAGFARNDISVVAQNASDLAADGQRSVGTSTGNESGEGAAAGAGIGAVAGGVLGLLVGIGALAIPGIGPVLAAGPLAAAIGSGAAGTLIGAAGGAATGGLLGALVGAGIPDEDANLYAEGVRRGGTLVTVSAADDMAMRASDILNRHGAVDIDSRGENWRSRGWNRFDTDAGPYDRSGDSLGDKWEDSSKVGTAGGTLAGAATGAAAGAVAGPVGAVVGGVAGAAAGAGLGAAGDAAGEGIKDETTGEGRSSSSTMRSSTMTGTTGTGMTGRSDVTARSTNEGEQVLPVVEEELRVGKRAVERGGVRVYTRVEETPVEEQVRLREEHVNVERRPVDRPLSDADRDAFRERSVEMTERSEEAVIDKRARVVEEVVINKDVTERTETVRDTVRRTDVDVEQTGGQMMGATSMTDLAGFETFDSDFRTHYQTYGANSGYSYEDYSPVYRYGYNLAGDQNYRGRNWSDIESDARRRWEERNPNTWDRFADSVRFAWERATGQR